MPASIELERREQVAIVRLNRSNKLNALSSEMFSLLEDVLRELQPDCGLRSLILTGAGDRAFCAGTDISALIDVNESSARNVSSRGQSLCNKIEKFPVPVIAAINGIAAGGGCELALSCHLRIASSHASFSLPETSLGIIPAYGGTQRLAREVGIGRAVEIMIAGQTLSAETALEIGLINRLTAPSDLMDEALSIAARIAQLAPLAIRACLRAVIDGSELPLNEGLELERELFASLFATDDVSEGTTAFVEKRKPQFKGQ
ncbi:MAG: enoyl-CoA hydratase/isomerase family protein [Pyrinomonadaceae bacterium]